MTDRHDLKGDFSQKCTLNWKIWQILEVLNAPSKKNKHGESFFSVTVSSFIYLLELENLADEYRAY